jgi:hypothetical protein
MRKPGPQGTGWICDHGTGRPAHDAGRPLRVEGQSHPPPDELESEELDEHDELVSEELLDVYVEISST